MSSVETDQIWNRAAMDNGGSSPSRGDRALSALLMLHGMVMNGGVEHAAESLSPVEFTAGIEGFQFFGFPEVSKLLESAVTTDETEFDQLDHQYWNHIPSDSTIVHAFQSHLLSSPQSFSPLK
jgi:hypothetical protein